MWGHLAERFAFGCFYFDTLVGFKRSNKMQDDPKSEFRGQNMLIDIFRALIKSGNCSEERLLFSGSTLEKTKRYTST